MEAINEEIFRAYDIRGTYPKTINEQVAFTLVGVMVLICKKNIIKILV